MPPTINFAQIMGVRQDADQIGAQNGRGRGSGLRLPTGECLCDRSRSHVICHVCGYLGWGRLRRGCTKHPQTIFLIDMTQCPNCRAYEFMMSEV